MRPLGIRLEFVVAWMAILGLVVMLALIRGPVSRLFDLPPMLLVFGGATAFAVLAAPLRAHAEAWRLGLGNGPVEPGVARRARSLLRAQAKGLLVMGGVAALVELVWTHAVWTEPQTAQMLINAVTLPLLYAVGTAGTFVWPLEASLARRAGMPESEVVPRSTGTMDPRVLLGAAIVAILVVLGSSALGFALVHGGYVGVDVPSTPPETTLPPSP